VADREYSVLHVLPHPGGGGETYVDGLSTLVDYRTTRVFLSTGPAPRDAAKRLPQAVRNVLREARRHDLLHVHGEVASAFCLPSLATCPSVVTFHGLNLVRRSTGAKLIAARSNLRLIVRAASKAICVAHSERREVAEAAGSKTARDTVVIHYGIPIPTLATPEERAAIRAELGLGPSTAAVVFVGTIEPVKDPLTAVRAADEAVRRGVDMRLLIVGDGPLRAEVERARGANVHLLGFRRDVARILRVADLLVLPSLREGLPFAVLEGLAAGVVPVVSNVPGSVEAVGEAGIVAAVGDAAAFADAFVQLLNDSEERARLGAVARERAVREFSLDRMLRSTRAVYDEVLAR
jgi:glycosyltransferase involved in cell wall biosynthesis